MAKNPARHYNKYVTVAIKLYIQQVVREFRLHFKVMNEALCYYSLAFDRFLWIYQTHSPTSTRLYAAERKTVSSSKQMYHEFQSEHDKSISAQSRNVDSGEFNGSKPKAITMDKKIKIK